MANEDDKKSGGEEEPTELYKFSGMKDSFDDTGRLILKGSAVNPVVYMDRGGEPVALTEAQVAKARAAGAKVSPLTEKQQEKLEERQAEQEEGAPPKGATQAPGTPAGREGSAGPQTGSKSDK